MKSTVSLVAAPGTAAALSSLTSVNRKTMPDDAQRPPYPQVFGYKFGFTKGLSQLDSLANTGS